MALAKLLPWADDGIFMEGEHAMGMLSDHGLSRTA